MTFGAQRLVSRGTDARPRIVVLLIAGLVLLLILSIFGRVLHGILGNHTGPAAVAQVLLRPAGTGVDVSVQFRAAGTDPLPDAITVLLVRGDYGLIAGGSTLSGRRFEYSKLRVNGQPRAVPAPAREIDDPYYGPELTGLRPAGGLLRLDYHVELPGGPPVLVLPGRVGRGHLALDALSFAGAGGVTVDCQAADVRSSQAAPTYQACRLAAPGQASEADLERLVRLTLG